MAAPIPVKSYCLLLFEKIFIVNKYNKLILGMGNAIWWVIVPYYQM
jgi:hypothetical protein